MYGNLRLDLVKKHPDVEQCVQGLSAGSAEQVLQAMGNLLEHSTFRLQPNVEKLKQHMIEHGCRHVLMSGSGPTVFAAFTERQQAQQYYQKVKQEYPGAIVAQTVNQKMLKERVELYGDE